MIPHASLLTVGMPLLGAALIPLAARFGPRVRLATALAAGLATAVCSVSLLRNLRQGTAFAFQWTPAVSFSLGLDALSVFMATIAGVLGFLIIVYSLQYMVHETDLALTRYYALVLLFIGAMIGLVLTTNLLVLYFFWELAGLCSFALIGFNYRNPEASAAGIKAFITTRIGDVGLFAAIMALYYGTNPHSLDMQAIITAATRGEIAPSVLAFAAFAMLAGAAGKSAQVPLHVWLPDAMEAPTPVSALIHAATMVNAGIYLMARFHPAFAAVPHWSQAVMWLGLVTAALAALAAVMQYDLKRLLAYSTVSQLGFMMFAVGTGDLVAAQFHLLSHAVFKALLFLCAGSVIHAAGTRDMRVMGGFGKQMRITAASFFIGACALAGIPIFNGFWSKDLIFAAAYEAGQILPFFLLIMTAALTVAYSFRAFTTVFLGTPKRTGHEVHAGEAPLGMAVPVVVLALGVLVSWLSIGVFTDGLAETGFAVPPVSVGELIRETLAPTPALLGSAVALALGLLAFFKQKSIASYGRQHWAPLLPYVRSGFGFDQFYDRCQKGLVGIGRALFSSYDEQVADGLDYVFVSAFRKASSALRKGHTGNLSLELLGIIVGLLTVILVVFYL
ncbi:MAG: NADH-quinone oxidoreductase subunit L [Bacteroidota bacterium]